MSPSTISYSLIEGKPLGSSWLSGLGYLFYDMCQFRYIRAKVPARTFINYFVCNVVFLGPVVILHATVMIHPPVMVQFAWQLQDQANGDDFV